MAAGNLKQRLKAGETLFGIFCDIPSPQIVEMAGLIGYDFAFIDAEHTAAGLDTVEHMVRAADTRGLASLVRVGHNHHSSILRHVDNGANGVLMPLVNSAEDVRDAVAAVKYPPLGRRGLAHVRAAGYAVNTGLGEFMAQSNAETVVMVQIETAEAVKNLDAICAVEELDAVFFGATDLAASLGYSAQLQASGSEHPEIIKLVLDLGERAMKAGKPVGISAHSPAAYNRWCSAGFQIVATVASLQFVAGARGLLRDCRPKK